jgi:UPF0755 protein
MAFAAAAALSPAKYAQLRAEPVAFTIREGEGFASIAFRLYEQGIIPSRFSFMMQALASGKKDGFLPGAYTIASRDVREIIKILTNVPRDKEVTIVPGMTLKEADERLANAGVIQPGQLANMQVASLEGAYPFLRGAKSLEGFIMPDTYRFKPKTDAAAVANALLDNFKRRTADLSSGSVSYEELIVASLLEKEVVSSEDKRLVAGIIRNRMAEDMPLQIDATVVYAACRGRFSGCDPLKRDDFSIESPYNTYRIKGLPPAPISNPSADSLRAAQDPARTPYLYYLSDSRTKQTIFSTTFEEHNRNRQKYLNL